MRRYFALLSRDQWVIFVAWLLWGLGNGLWFNLQTLYIEHLGANPKQVGAVVGLSGLAVMFLYIPAGLLADRWRRKPLILGGWIAGTLATLGVAFATDWRWAIPGLALYWLSSFSRPAVTGHIAATDQSGNIGRSFAILATAFFVGEVVSPGLGGWIGEKWGLRAVFLCATGLYLLSTLAVWQLTNLPTPPRDHRSRPERLMLDRVFLWQIFVILFIIFALDLGFVLSPNYLHDLKGLSIQQIGQLGTASALGRLVLMFLFGQMHVERRTSLLLNQLAAILALVLLLSTPAGRGGAPPLIFSLAFFLRGADRAIFPILRGRLSLWLQPAVLSLGFSFVDTATRIAQTASPFLAGQLYALHPTLPLYGGMVALGASILLALTLPRVRQPVALAGVPATTDVQPAPGD